MAGSTLRPRFEAVPLDEPFLVVELRPMQLSARRVGK